MRFLFCLGLAFFVLELRASCMFADEMLSFWNEDAIVYKFCAENMNDDASQAKLAEMYDKGTETVQKSLPKALFYYQLSAENGNAASQARLADLYMSLDEGPESRARLYDYLNSIIVLPGSSKQGKRFEGELIHPYVLLILANEKPENKWYYSTEVKEAPEFAKKLYQNYQLDDAKKKQFMQQATAWKKRKLLEVASRILSDEEYQSFTDTLYPKEGSGDAFKRNQALKDFKEKVLQAQEQERKSVKTFY